MLLALLTADSVTTADLGYANRIVSWLVKQQNAYGGFSSTQVTQTTPIKHTIVECAGVDE